MIKLIKNLYLHFFEKANQPLHLFTRDNYGQMQHLCTIQPFKNESLRNFKKRGFKTVQEILERQDQERPHIQ